MTFNEGDINREADGKFGEKTGAAPEFELEVPPGPWVPRLGEHVIHTYPTRTQESGQRSRSGQVVAIEDDVYTMVYDDEGDTASAADAHELYPNPAIDSTAAIRKFETFDAGNKAILNVAYDASDEDVARLNRISRRANDAWFDLHADFRFSQIGIRDMQADALTAEGLDASDSDEFYALLSEAGDGAYRSHVDGENMQRAQAVNITHLAAEAAHYREFVGDPRFPKWTQETYDHVTRPYREVFGRIHPDDEAEPASWSRRPMSTK